MKILVIIVSYNFTKWIDRCIPSVIRQTVPADIMVIDNHSSDQTTAILEEKYPMVRVIKEEKNLGFGKANNIGMEYALQKKYDAVFLLNQDAWIEPDTLETLASVSQKHPEYGILSPVHLTGKGDSLDPGFAHYAQHPESIKKSSTEQIIELPFINAAFWYIPTSVLQKVGGFSPLFYHYGEDKDFTNRIHYNQFKIGYCPQTHGCHDREFRAPSLASFLRTEEVFHLSEFSNPNYSFAKAFAWGILATAKKGFKDKNLLKITWKLLMRTTEIIHIRNIINKEGPHFLDI